MRRIALINQKGGVGKTTTAVNLGAALARAGKRVVLVDLDPQGNLTLHLGHQLQPEEPSTYGVLIGRDAFADAIRPTNTPGLSLVGTTIDLSGAELELATALGRETLLRDAMDEWRRADQKGGGEPADYVLFDCPPSLGLLSINALTAASEIYLTVQTEFFALQGMSKLLELVTLVQRRLHRALKVSGIIACLYDSRLRLAREVLAELRKHFPDEIFHQAIGTNVKLAESPSFGQTIFEYAPESNGARDYNALAREVLAQEEAPERAQETPPAETPAPAEAAPPAETPAPEEAPAPEPEELATVTLQPPAVATPPGATQAPGALDPPAPEPEAAPPATPAPEAG